MNLDKPCPRCGGSVSKGWIGTDGRACPACGVHLKPSPNLKPIYFISLISGIIIVQILELLAEEWNIQIPGGAFSLLLMQILITVIFDLFIFKKYVTMLVDDANAEETQSINRTEREKDIDH